MTQTIWKQTVEPELRQRILLPRGSSVISCEAQGEKLNLWYLVRDKEAEKVPVDLFVIPTGLLFENPNPATFIGTVRVIHDLVFHIFVYYTTGYADHA